LTGGLKQPNDPCLSVFAWLESNCDDFGRFDSETGTVGHYNPVTISLDGFVLDPQLAKVA
jgi:hypothetical protein